MNNVQYSMNEVKEYLEEMVASDLAIKVEQDVYQDLKWYGRCKKAELEQVYERMNDWIDY